MSKEYTVLIAEDDQDIVEILKLYLTGSGFHVIDAKDGEEALQLLSENHVDMAILDIMMPKMNGYELTGEIRKKSSIPIMILSAKNQDTDKILGLDLGADDYITKPFNALEIVARVKASLRRYYHLNDQAQQSEDQVLIGDLKLDRASMTLEKRGEMVYLTPTEYKILAFLMQHPGRVFTRVQIYENVSAECSFGDESAIMVHICNLREKIEDNPKEPRYLKTIRGLGYKMEKQK
ncbi:MAG: response regulator transcription factor [Lachnospiraceae bacterium]|nr:response regulator transcription factor [Lachnospiraceae bacterium]